MQPTRASVLYRARAESAPMQEMERRDRFLLGILVIEPEPGAAL
jgi:hypothetical protein